MTDPGALHVQPFVLVGPRGVEYLGLHTDEADCWRVALGWPRDEDIEAAKMAGRRVYPATVTWKESKNA